MDRPGTVLVPSRTAARRSPTARSGVWKPTVRVQDLSHLGA